MAVVEDPVEHKPAQQRQPPAAPPPAPQRRRSRLRWPLMLAGIVIAAVAALAYYLFTGRYMSTDDSALMAAQTSISSNVPGRVVELDVHDNQLVHRGQVLFRLDERPLRIAVGEAQAKLATTQLQIHAAEASYRHELADLTAARDTVAYERSEFARQQHLVQSGISSRAQYEQAQHALQLSQSQLVSTQQLAASYLALLGGNPNMKISDHPVVMEAQSALDRAKLQLSYTTIRAPEDGVVTKVEQLQVGDYISAASPVFSLISTTDVWVEANFKEDQLAHMRPGQPAEVTIDAYPGRRFKARVASLSPGTGATFSLLPPENATGNWVKVVQRVPVRLQLLPEPGEALPLDGSLSGLSADVTVDTGYRRSLAAHLFHGGTDERVTRR
ncbi:MAG TPA: HlyD family secretion protein [Steroidobacteraceae bacterium]|jgi:membrane fusion protein (multidrug efflux system)|nr:HlyD family secretion protein [Steroidobacteraceae bacterium]